jgi:uncharacterized SAM-binding protein YcdF (DUF218 family)
MSDKEFVYDNEHPTIRLRVWVLGQMIWGAFLAGIFLLAIAGVMVAIWLAGLLLSERSRETPSPYSAIEMIQTDTVV